MTRARQACQVAKFECIKTVLARLLEMLECGRVVVEATDGTFYRPPLQKELGTLLFPAEVAAFPRIEDNRTVYRLIAVHHAGRRKFGTVSFDHESFLREFSDIVLARWLFLVCDGARVDAALARCYRGLEADLRWLSRVASGNGRAAPVGSVEHFLSWLASSWPSCLPAGRHWLARLAGEQATVQDSARATLAIYIALKAAAVGNRLRGAELARLAESLAAADRQGAHAGESPMRLDPLGGQALARETDAAAKSAQAEGRGGNAALDLSSLSVEDLLDLLKHIERAGGEKSASTKGNGGPGLFLENQTEEIIARKDQAHLGPGPEVVTFASSKPLGHRTAQYFLYDEWDYEKEGYRSMWCRLSEVPVTGQDDSFFVETLRRHAALLSAVRRQFQQLKPEGYRTLKKLEDGEDFDLCALVDACADRRAGRIPSPKLYAARRPVSRDIATLFLLDMSASTDEVLPGESPCGRRRVIDVIKEAIVIMAGALEEIGDGYAIYGFSGHGRKQVETYVIKPFDEPLSPSVKGRIGAIGPKRSTRMGAALRHAIGRLRILPARRKNIIMLSDGFPQDIDYGDDRRSNVYGIYDTMMALREAVREGIRPFCVTVDKAGHDYLGQMCEPSGYLVIEDVASLPRELPKIYQSVASFSGKGPGGR